MMSDTIRSLSIYSFLIFKKELKEPNSAIDEIRIL